MQYNLPVVKETKIKFSVWKNPMIITLCRDKNKQSTLKRFWKQWKVTWELLFLLHCFAHSTINRLGKNWNQIHLYHSSTELNCVIATLVTAIKPDQGPFLKTPETHLWATFGWHNSLCIFKTKTSRGMKLCSYFKLYSLYNISKDQLYRIRGLQF